MNIFRFPNELFLTDIFMRQTAYGIWDMIWTRFTLIPTYSVDKQYFQPPSTQIPKLIGSRCCPEESLYKFSGSACVYICKCVWVAGGCAREPCRGTAFLQPLLAVLLTSRRTYKHQPALTWRWKCVCLLRTGLEWKPDHISAASWRFEKRNVHMDRYFAAL